MRDQRQLIKHKEAQQFRQENIALNEASIQETMRQENDLRNEVAKYRQIKKIIREE